MNSFFERHKDSIRWHYRCFDRILLNGLIQPFQQPERVVGFFVSPTIPGDAVYPIRARRARLTRCRLIIEESRQILHRRLVWR